MVQHDSKDFSVEEGSSPAEIIEETTDEPIVEKTSPKKKEHQKKLIAKAVERGVMNVDEARAVIGLKPILNGSGHELDQGEWKYRPWNGVPHWVNERTGASTFDLKKVR